MSIGAGAACGTVASRYHIEADPGRRDFVLFPPFRAPPTSTPDSWSE